MPLIYEEPGICTPCVTHDRIYLAYHKGKEIFSIDHSGGDRRVELRIETACQCHGHISSPFVSGKKMYYHGPGKGGQRTYASFWCIDRWIDCIGPLAHPYYQEFGPYGLAKYRGIQFYHGYKPIKHVPGRFRHCHVNNGWLYYSSIGDKPESIYRVRIDQDLNIDWRTAQLVIYPDLSWGPISETVSGPARHRCEVRDPFVYDGYLYFIGRGEEALYRKRLP